MRALEVAVALLLLVLALPRLGAAVAELPGRPVLEALEAGRAVPPEALTTLAASAQRSTAWTASGAASKAAGAALMRLGDDAAAARLLAQGLALSPADPYGWLHLAHAAPSQAPRALALSVRTGRWERDVAHDRLRLAGEHYADLDTATRADILEQLRWLWRLDAPGLMKALPPEAHWPLYRRALDGEALAAVAKRVGLD